MFGPQTGTTALLREVAGDDILYHRAGCQSADEIVVLTQPACIDQWTRRPLTERGINSGRSKMPAKALRAERAGLERNKPLRYSAAGAPTHVGANGAKPEHLSPPEISRRLSTGGAVIEMSACTTKVEAVYVPKMLCHCTISSRPQGRKRGGLGERGAGASLPQLPSPPKINHTSKYDQIKGLATNKTLQYW